MGFVHTSVRESSGWTLKSGVRARAGANGVGRSKSSTLNRVHAVALHHWFQLLSFEWLCVDVDVEFDCLQDRTGAVMGLSPVEHVLFNRSVPHRPSTDFFFNRAGYRLSQLRRSV